MSLSNLISISFFSSFASAAVLLSSLPPSNIALGLQTLSNPAALTTIANTTTQPSNVIRFQCDSVNFGHHLSPGSCRWALNHVGSSDKEEIWAERHTSSLSAFPLPLRIPSSDGTCYVQPQLLHGARTARASSNDVIVAASIVFEKCVAEKHMGGIAINIGGDNHLNVVIANYAPHVRCDSSGTPSPSFKSCLSVVSDMTATKVRKVFGDQSQDKRVEVNLPFTFKSIDARCMLVVDIKGKSTSATWYEIWEAVTALNAVCVRDKNQGGKAYGMGLRKNIFVELSDEHPDLSLLAASITNVSASAPLLGLEASNAISDGEGSEWTSVPSVEVATGPGQGNGTLLVEPGDASLDTPDDSAA